MSLGPCSDWLDGEDVAACCTVESSDASVFEPAAEAAQELLYELSGRVFAGECTATVRPCRTTCGCGGQVLSRGHVIWRNDSWFCDGVPCGCASLSRVRLAGRVRAITEVKIDGTVVAADTYRLDDHRWLTRVRDPANQDVALRWPGCQALDKTPDQDGTFQVIYTYGLDPPELGVQAAAQLACEIHKSCSGDTACKLPAGTVRVIRQGITIEKSAFLSWAFQKGGRGQASGWITGLSLVDAFLNAYNPSGLQRPPVIWAPSSTRRYPARLGT